jgi:hypothetical protein
MGPIFQNGALRMKSWNGTNFILGPIHENSFQIVGNSC